MRASRPLAVATAVVLGVVLLASCSDGDPDRVPPAQGHGHDESVDTPAGKPLRDGERFLDLTMPKSYTPKAPTAPGTDDYRCFLLDPGLDRSAFVTGLEVLPGRRDLVHHVILFKVPPEQVDEARRQDAGSTGQGWTCFGGAGVRAAGKSSLEAAPWLGSWAPGRGERILADDVGIPLEARSRIIMQVHYNLMEDGGPDTSRARLRVAPGGADLEPLSTTLLLAPVELACRADRSGPLCDRDAALRDVAQRFGLESVLLVSGLQARCGGESRKPRAAPVQTCDRTIRTAATVRAVAGHMHLLGRSITITVNPGRRDERRLLDIPVWDFDDQGTESLRKPVDVEPGDVLRLTCRHDQALRDDLPALANAPERYVVWGEGTTDEMCLGIVMVTRPGEN